MDDERDNVYTSVDRRERTLGDLVFSGFNSRVVALDRETGEIVWQWKSPQGRSSHVSMLLDGDRLIASVHGYMYCLDPIDGRQLWMNPLKGFGFGIAGLASIYGNSGSAAAAAVILQQQRSNQQHAGH